MDFLPCCQLKKSYSMEKPVALSSLLRDGEGKDDKPDHHLLGSLCQGSWSLRPSTEQITIK